MRFAADVEERLPFVLGKLIVAQIKGVEEKAETEPVVPAQQQNQAADETSSVEAISADNLHKLVYVVLASRFPNDTGSTRLRQVGFLAAVAAEIADGRKPTASSIANHTDNHVSQITGLAKTMKDRGSLMFATLRRFERARPPRSSAFARMLSKRSMPLISR